jgi:peptidoglycan/xylan/chitin deacetylase (PgdA/CDA1 family)
MKIFQRVSYVVAAIAVVGTLAAGVFAPQGNAEAANLIGNSSFETATADNPTAPAGWFTDIWGANTAALTYINDAHTGTKAAQTTVTNYQDGDAKWLFNAVSVTSGSDYTYSDWYKANTGTNLWAQFLMNDGTYQYKFLKADSASSDWAQVSVQVTVPANVAKMSIFHVLSANGQLEIDDASLTAAIVNPTCTPSYINGLANGDFEDTCLDSTGMPAGWTGVQYGATTASFETTANAYHGTRAVTVTNGADGAEAGFLTTIQSPVANQRYSLSFAQEGNTYAYAYLTIGLTDGSTQYQSLMSVPATLGAWSQYADNFVTPANIKSLQITIATSGVGSLSLDSVALTSLQNQTPANFTAGMISLTFDDGAKSTYTNGFPVLKQYGYKGTFYLNAGSIDTTNFMTTKQVQALAANGQEIGSHLYHHSDMVQLDDTTLRSELSGNQAGLAEILGTPNFATTDFASPYGSFTSNTVNTVMGYELSHRDTDGQTNSKADLNSRQIHGRLVTPGTTLATMQAWIADAQTNHTWLVLVYHNIASSTAGEADGEAGYTVTPAQFKKQLAAISQSGIAVQPVNTALATLQAQE